MALAERNGVNIDTVLYQIVEHLNSENFTNSVPLFFDDAPTASKIEDAIDQIGYGHDHHLGKTRMIGMAETMIKAESKAAMDIDS